MTASNSERPGEAGQEKSPGARIRTARMARKWSLQKLAQEMRREATKRREPAPAAASLKSMLSKWQNDKLTPNEYNRRLLAAVLGVAVEDLGLSTDPDFTW